MPLLEQVLEMYPEEVRVVELHYPLSNHQYARPAAAAALAAGKQGKFWELHARLFDNYNKLDDKLIVKLARDLGLDMEQFERDIKSREVNNIINRDLAQAQRHGVQGTPTVFINGKRPANRSLEEISRMIDRELGREQATLSGKPAGSGARSPSITTPNPAVNAECG